MAMTCDKRSYETAMSAGCEAFRVRAAQEGLIAFSRRHVERVLDQHYSTERCWTATGREMLKDCISMLKG